MPIAQEGRWPLTLLLAAALAVGIAIDWRATWPIWALAAFLGFLFRQPSRAVAASPLAVLSPVDGRVEELTQARDPFLDRPALRVSIRQNLFGPYVVYAPTEGKLQRLRGTGTIALLVHTDEGDELTMEAGRGRLPRYLHCSVSAGERMRQGGVCGFSGFGRHINLYLPSDTRIEVEVGQQLRAAQPLAKLQRHTA